MIEDRTLHQPAAVCSACGETRTGPFCSRCGQQHTGRMVMGLVVVVAYLVGFEPLPLGLGTR